MVASALLALTGCETEDVFSLPCCMAFACCHPRWILAFSSIIVYGEIKKCLHVRKILYLCST